MSRRYLRYLRHVEDSSSDDDNEEFILTTLHAAHAENEDMNTPRWGGSVPGREYVHRDRETAHRTLYNDYFSENPTYGPTFFRRRFRMYRSLFLRIMHAVEGHDDYFVQKRDTNGRLGLSCLQKVTAAFMMLSQGIPADFMDHYIKIGESTVMESLRRFAKAVVEVFGSEYLRSPNNNDTARLLAINEKRGFPGMLGSVDCMHWGWKNCPSAWHGQYTGHAREPTIILEAVASKDLWIWHAFFGLPGSLNDINVLHRSHLFAKLAEGEAPEVNYNINGHSYTMGYYLADGIYPQWATFVKPKRRPRDNKQKCFAAAQAAVRKDVERAFGVLQARFAIVRGPARLWDKNIIREIMNACIIMHNMIVEDERDEDEDEDQMRPSLRYDNVGDEVRPSRAPTRELSEFFKVHRDIKDSGIHSQLQEDLMEHLWHRHGSK